MQRVDVRNERELARSGYWNNGKNKIRSRNRLKTVKETEFVFYEGPPTAMDAAYRPCAWTGY